MIMKRTCRTLQTLILVFTFFTFSNLILGQSSLDGLTEAVTIDGQPALRILGKKGVSTEVRYKLSNDKESFVFLAITITSAIGKSLEGKLYVSKQEIKFEPFGNAKSGFLIERFKIQNATIVSKDFGKWSLVKVETISDRILFQIRFDNDGVFNGNKKYAIPANNFLVKSILDFNSALADFNRLTLSVRSKENT